MGSQPEALTGRCLITVFLPTSAAFGCSCSFAVICDMKRSGAAHEGSQLGKSQASAHAQRVSQEQQTAAPCSSPGWVPNLLTTTGLSPPAEVPPTPTRKFSNPIRDRKGKLPAPDLASTR